VIGKPLKKGGRGKDLQDEKGWEAKTHAKKSRGGLKKEGQPKSRLKRGNQAGHRVPTGVLKKKPDQSGSPQLKKQKPNLISRPSANRGFWSGGTSPLKGKKIIRGGKSVERQTDLSTSKGGGTRWSFEHKRGEMFNKKREMGSA